MSNTLDVCETGYDYEQYQLNELENENMKLREQIAEANEILKIAIPNPIRPGGYGPILNEYIERTLNYFKKWKV